MEACPNCHGPILPGHHCESVRRVKIVIDETDSDDSILVASHRPTPSMGKHQASGSGTKVAATSGSGTKRSTACGSGSKLAAATGGNRHQVAPTDTKRHQMVQTHSQEVLDVVKERLYVLEKKIDAFMEVIQKLLKK
ncbi:hypothetical protein GUJ93_ZPchr0012g19265 [Zizania palustris]|uniref:Uncharacterized protein n=1 Tax=Zizania palustris TaxID=103762 RepID=A0A8J5WUX0_ZIZPA|nr:hypothetical protein GUJ93_ZPchr0012g19265 [Zizania palustris]